MFAYPKQAEFNRVVPKTKIYQYARPSSRIKQLFVDQVDRLVWRYKLAPETINLPARPAVAEIQIFTVTLKTGELNEELLRAIDRAVVFPIFYELEYQDRIRLAAAYKRPNDADPAKWVVDSYFQTQWLPSHMERQPLPVALDLEKLYEAMFRRLLPLPSRPGEPLKAQVERLSRIQSTQKEAQRLETRLHREKQFNRKVELNSRLRTINSELDRLFDRKA